MNSQWKTGLMGGVMGATAAIAVVFGAASVGYFPSPSDKQFRGYLMAHPSIIFEMRDQAAANDYDADERKIQSAVDKLGMHTFLDPKLAYVTGPASAKKTVVEFFDYNCGHCRS